MSEIVLGAATRQSLASLQSIASGMSLIQKRLATGKRVNEPSDDPAAYFTSMGLSARASALSGLIDGIATAQRTVDAANAGIAAVQSLIKSAQGVANQALAISTNFVKITGTNSTALTAASVIASTAGSATAFKAGDTVTVSDGTTTATYTAADADTVQTFLDAVNNTADLKVTASLNASGQVTLQATSNVNVTVGGTLTGTGTLNGVIGLTAGATNFTASTARQSLAQQFDLLRTQIDQAIADASYNGVNLISGGSLSVAFNEAGTSKLTLGETTLSASGLGMAAAANTFQTDTDVKAALTNITSALTALQSQSAVLGSKANVMQARQDFTKTLVDQLKSGADALVMVDTNEESAQLLALQTRQQIATSILSITQGSAQSALRLLGL
jgi:flagellin-like hook-associated protein FlgL